jgi:hypothetical protein
MNNWQTIQEYITEIENLLKSETPTNTGNLKDSIDASVIPSSNGAQITFDMAYYGKFIDQGVNGIYVSWGSPFSFTDKRPPASAFSTYTSDKSQQYAIANSVFFNGIKPRNFIQPVIDEKIDGLADIISESLFDNYFNQRNTKEKTIKLY